MEEESEMSDNKGEQDKKSEKGHWWEEIESLGENGPFNNSINTETSVMPHMKKKTPEELKSFHEELGLVP